MIFIGNDIVEVSRINRLLEKYGKHFIEKIFSIDETSIVNKKKDKAIHYSGKFSAKESVRKALLSAGFGNNIYLKDIEILNKEDGSPYIRIKKLKFISQFSNIKAFQISISHTSVNATAFALLDIKGH